jgi:phenylacetate-CoA ligase
MVESAVEGLLSREFLDPAKARDLERRELGQILRFARSEVPFYQSQEIWSGLPLGASVDRDVLAELPILRKHHIHENFDALKARRLPNGELVAGQTRSSGTTGRPTKVLFGGRAIRMYGLLAQRGMRWARFDPTWKQAVIRLPQNLPRRPDGSVLADGDAHRSRGWMYVRHWFHTGTMVGFNRTNSAEAQTEWLQKERAQYLVTFPGSLETLVYACQGKPVDSLLALHSISATLTQGMRDRVESATGLTVHQSYGLNEIGTVALRCEAGRYHVNPEHCLVEIVDENGSPCKAGETGRIVVTGLTNFVMPLIRYDTGDLGVAVDGACDCGRTLPSFGTIVGRYRPMQYTPEGTARHVNIIQATIAELPLEALSGLREYQIHQFRDGSFELRLATKDEDNTRLTDALRQVWDAQTDVPPPLRILRVGEVRPTSGGKQQEFTSDFFPPIEEGS